MLYASVRIDGPNMLRDGAAFENENGDKIIAPAYRDFYRSLRQMASANQNENETRTGTGTGTSREVLAGSVGQPRYFKRRTRCRRLAARTPNDVPTYRCTDVPYFLVRLTQLRAPTNSVRTRQF
ncbi:hypothetical protein ACFE04_008321 [Oxalis oulophora]